MSSWRLWMGLFTLVGSGCLPGGKAEFEQTCSPAPHIEGNPPPQATATHPYTAHFTGGYSCGFAGGCFSLEPLSLPAPAIQTFTASPLSVPPGGTTTLLPVFTHGTGRMVIWTSGATTPVESGMAVQSSPLVVTNTLGDGTSSTVTVTVE